VASKVQRLSMALSIGQFQTQAPTALYLDLREDAAGGGPRFHALGVWEFWDPRHTPLLHDSRAPGARSGLYRPKT
jgi:hypothetical protein